MSLMYTFLFYVLLIYTDMFILIERIFISSCSFCVLSLQVAHCTTHGTAVIWHSSTSLTQKRVPKPFGFIMIYKPHLSLCIYRTFVTVFVGKLVSSSTAFLSL